MNLALGVIISLLLLLTISVQTIDLIIKKEDKYKIILQFLVFSVEISRSKNKRKTKKKHIKNRIQTSVAMLKGIKYLLLKSDITVSQSVEGGLPLPAYIILPYLSQNAESIQINNDDNFIFKATFLTFDMFKSLIYCLYFIVKNKIRV